MLRGLNPSAARRRLQRMANYQPSTLSGQMARLALRRGQGQTSVNYNGAASRRTLQYRNRGEFSGSGAAVYNRVQSLRARYGDDPRISRAAANILSNATT